MVRRFKVAAFVAGFLVTCGPVSGQHAKRPHLVAADERRAILRRSEVWSPTTISNMDLRAGPGGHGAFAPGETVTCDYVDRTLSGSSPKFSCAIDPEDEVKVKFGASNGEVYGEVAATRLLWALGFGADHMYPVRVICRGCPATLHGVSTETPGESLFDPAAIERKAPGRAIESKLNGGWAWRELDLVDESAGGAPRAHRDALKLLAVLLQHTDNKPEQQRLVCLDKAEGPPTVAGADAECEHPFMLIQDVGLTFGRGDWYNRDKAGVNFKRWSRTPIWTNATDCVGNLHGSFSGSLHHPVISEAGRQFLASLLAQLSDHQLYDLFDVSRVTSRSNSWAAPTTVEDWVTAFKEKRNEIANRHCSSSDTARPVAH